MRPRKPSAFVRMLFYHKMSVPYRAKYTPTLAPVWEAAHQRCLKRESKIGE